MQIEKYAKKKTFPYFLMGLIALLLTSCGTYSNSTYGSADGIYSSGSATTQQEVEQAVTETEEDGGYYQEYFRAKGQTYENINKEDEIFTDIEEYSTTESISSDGRVVIEDVQYEEGNAAWGSNSDNVTLNIYNGGGFGWANNWYNPYWGWGNGWGWGNSWAWGPRWGYGIGFGWWGFNNFGYGGFWCPPYWSPYYNNHFYYNNFYGYGRYNTVAYNRGRRNLDYSSGRIASRGRSNASSLSRGNYSRSEINRRNSYRTNPRGTAVNRGRPSRPNSSASRPSRPSRPNSSASRPSRPSRPNNSASRPSRPSRPSYSRPSRPSRPSGSFNRGGSRSSRSSGVSRGGSRRGGRG